MADQIHIDHEELRAHADKLNGVSDDIGTAAGTAEGVHLHDGAFGLLLGWLPGVIEKFNPTGAGTIRSSSTVVRSAATAVRALADDFHDTDQQIADAMNHLRG